MHKRYYRIDWSWISWQRIAGVFALLLATIYTAWLIKVTTPATQTAEYGDTVPDYYLKDMIGIEFDSQGKLLHKIVSPKVIHIPANDTLLLRTPQITVYSEDNPPQSPWFISALHGKTINKNQRAWLWGQVVIHQPESTQNKNITILTSRVMVLPSDNIAVTHAPVTVIQPGLEVHSVGMRAYFKEKRVDLLSRAQGVYDANQAGDNQSQ